MPASFAAAQIVVPSGTVTSWPSIVRLTVLISVGAGVEMATVRLSVSSGGPDGRYGTATGILRVAIRPYPQMKILGSEPI